MASVAFSSTLPKRAVRTGRTSVVCQVSKGKKAAVAGIVASGLLLSAAPVFAVDADTLSEGKSVFNTNCTACHLKGNNSVLAERTLKKDAISTYLEGGFNVAAIKNQVNNGKGAMPAWKDRLDEDEINSVSEYVFDQASGGKW